MFDETLIADAGKIQISQPMKNYTKENISPNCFKVLNHLSRSELKSALFLLIGFIGPEIYSSLRFCSQEELGVKLKEVLNMYDSKLTIEIIGTLKKYKLLKELDMCKHKFCDINKSQIEPWKSLFDICENLDEEELHKLKKYFDLENRSLNCVEDLLCDLYLSKKCSDKSAFYTIIRQALTIMKRSDLVGKINCIAATEKISKWYDVRNPTPNNLCGLAIIVNQRTFKSELPNLKKNLVLEDRIGSQIDTEKFRDLWKNFGFRTMVYEDLPVNEIELLFRNLPINESNEFDIFVACLSSHGDTDGIYGSDCKLVKINSLISSVDKCQHLNGKPKLFFIQACQGKKHQQGYHINSRNVNSLGSDSIPEISDITPPCMLHVEQSDILIAVATIPGYVSYRSPTSGSIFVTHLVKILERHGDEEEIESVMKRVKLSTSEELCRQMAITFGTLRKSLMFKRLIS